ncbi:MAG TPA: hypothetical protein VEW46_25435, partial [Pyrinomonadaceae bacterium]|nr:hypothetical protein [Pyrinomonadaceae bacterium]
SSATPSELRRISWNVLNPGFQSQPWAGIRERFQRYWSYLSFHTLSTGSGSDLVGVADSLWKPRSTLLLIGLDGPHRMDMTNRDVRVLTRLCENSCTPFSVRNLLNHDPVVCGPPATV